MIHYPPIRQPTPAFWFWILHGAVAEGAYIPSPNHICPNVYVLYFELLFILILAGWLYSFVISIFMINMFLLYQICQASIMNQLKSICFCRIMNQIRYKMLSKWWLTRRVAKLWFCIQICLATLHSQILFITVSSLLWLIPYQLDLEIWLLYRCCWENFLACPPQRKFKFSEGL